MRHPRRSTAGTLLAAGALLATGVLAGPAAAGSAGPATSRAGAADPAGQQSVRDFWTPERMRSAAPLDLPAPSPGDLVTPRDRGRPTSIAPTPPTAHTDGFPEKGGPWTGGGAVLRTSGRVFFTFQGRTASCSGDAVTSSNASTVITAGHCVKYRGAWHTDWVFVPGYHDGQAPYGKWAAAKTLSTAQWVASEDINYDVGAAVVAPLEGRKLAEAVGAQGIAFDVGYNKPMYAFGFPAASPYDGTKLIHCSGDSGQDALLSKDHSLGCDMTGGSSGGPWFTSFDETTGAGLQSSVNSFGYTFLPGTMFGPYFGDDVKSLYEQAQSA
ncbi:trypsin-like serine peptidase [Streptomyces gamaensis]|uniref:Trypsin-like serine peptidase n=1 Tax=Streptomyces gamaensis TaxID=1763542 RepID=A0ABW0Z2C7_9ACTN